MKYSTILFDLDGTLTESGIGIRKSFDYALDKLFPGKVWPEEMFSGIIGPPLLWSCRETFGFDEETSHKAVALYRERYAVTGKFENRLYDGIEDMIKALHEKGIKICLCTSKPENFAHDIIEHFGIMKYFTFAGGASLGEERNNKIAVMRYVLENIEEKDKSRILMVGDKHHDLEAAQELGLDCAGVLYGYGSKEELSAYPNVILAQTADELRDFILNA